MTKVETKPAEHICRDDGYSPYVKPCPACMSQLSRNSAARRAPRA